MADILVRGVPDATHERLKARAAAAGRSLNDLLLGEIVAWADRPTLGEWVLAVERDLGSRLGGPTAAEIADLVGGARQQRS